MIIKKHLKKHININTSQWFNRHSMKIMMIIIRRTRTTNKQHTNNNTNTNSTRRRLLPPDLPLRGGAQTDRYVGRYSV